MANKTLNIIRQKIASLISPVKNTMTLANQFLKYGNKKMFPGWSDVEISDKDLYTGYPYAAIKITANMVAKVATENIYTDSNDDKEHPYLQKIDTSPTFTNREFWSEISTYLDLAGVYYLMVLRNVKNEQYGSVQSFKLLNPYNIKRVLNKETNQVSGYVESENGLVREIPPGMIIEMRELNPFNKNSPFAMTDALKENQFTIKTAGDFTRHTLKHNINAPGIMTTDVILDDKEFENFVARVKNHTKGEPIFGNGTGAITWQSMNIDLRNAALKDINEVNREALFAISGVSKTVMGIEQSGVTRETSKTQKDLSIENHVLPRIQLITDALNQDYKNNYPNEYKKNDSNILVKNPTATDYDKDIKEVKLKDSQIELYKKLIADGYDEESSAAFVAGDINVEDLVKVTIKKTDKPKVDEKEVKKKESIKKVLKKKIVKNKLDKKEKEKSGLIQQQEGALQNAIVNIETQFASNFINGIKKLVKNDINEETGLEDVITKTEKKESIDELILVLAAFYGVTMSFNGSSVMRKRVGKYALAGQFVFNKEIKNYIKETSKKVAESHIETIGNDLLRIAREAALKGYTQPQIINEIKNKFSYDISETRAKVVARTETNRAFTRSQYEADKQFIEQNELEGKVFKKWHTRSDHPCEFCNALANEGMIPFEESFRDVGQDVTVGKGKNKKTLNVDFEKLEAGNLHPNCSCEYELIIKN